MININKIKKLVKEKPKKYKKLMHIYNSMRGHNKLSVKGSNILEYGSSYIERTKIEIYGENNVIIIGDLCRVKASDILIEGNNNKVIVEDDVYLGTVHIRVENDNNIIHIGTRSTFCENVLLAAIESTNLSIGNDCMFSTNIEVRTGDGHTIIDSEGKRKNYSKDIVLGEHIWVGTRCLILKGTVIADNCIIGANSLVIGTHDDSNCMLVGNPVKVVKKDINWVRERI